MTPKKVPKGQPAISSFFSPKPSPTTTATTSSSSQGDDLEIGTKGNYSETLQNSGNGTSAKRKLGVFSHSPSKKSRQPESGDEVEEIEDPGMKASQFFKNTSKTSHLLQNSASSDKTPEASTNASVEVVSDDDNESSGSGAEFVPEPVATPVAAPKTQKRKSSSFRDRISTKRTTAPAKPKAVKSKSGASKLTPLEQQFKDLKSAHKDKVLAIQVGYKYKFFCQDAVVASQLLNIMLIPGNLTLEDRTHDRFAYCSIPDVRLHIHLQRLLNHGLKVGVVKQTETAAVKAVESANKSSVFERKITGVYTKATYMGDEAVGGGGSGGSGSEKYGAFDHVEPDRFVLCIDESGFPGETGIVAVQPATGDILYDAFVDTLAREQLETRLAYLDPSEVLVVGKGEHVSKEVSVVLKLQNAATSVSYVQAKDPEEVSASLSAFFESLAKGEGSDRANESGISETSGSSSIPGSTKTTAELTLFFSAFPRTVQRCVCELIHYLSEFNLSNIFTITSNFASFTEAGRYMVLPASTLRALDIFQVADDPTAKSGTLYALLNHTRTKKGASMLRGWLGKPLVNKADIQQRLDAVGCLASGQFVHVLDAFKRILAKIGRGGVDLDRLMIKIHYAATYGTDKITRKDLFSMMRSFYDVLEVFRAFGSDGIAELKKTSAQSALIAEIMEALLAASRSKTVDAILEQINGNAALNDKDLHEQKTGFFNHRSNRKYDAISEEFERIAEVEGALEGELETVRAFLKRPQLAYVTNLKETHLVEVRNGKAVDALPGDWLRISATKTVSRFRPPEVGRLHKQLQYHQERLLAACDACFNAFLQEIDAEYEYFREIVFNLARFDCLLSLASLVQDEGHVKYVKPALVDEQVVEITSGCHPILSGLSQTRGAYVPNDVSLSYDKNKVLIITGPNMGGKSSLVKQIALFVIMAQVGCFLPCSSATLGVFDSIYIRMGASDNILRGKSTFMVEMSECASIVQHYTPKSLVILDEIGRGTGTSDGIALAYAILKYIIEDDRGPLTLFITHYPSLHVLEDEHALVKNFHMAFVEQHTTGEGAENDWPEVVFLYKLVAGVVSNSYGLNVAKLAGINKRVIDSAYKISEAMKADVERGEVLGALAKMTRENAFDVLFNLF